MMNTKLWVMIFVMGLSGVRETKALGIYDSTVYNVDDEGNVESGQPGVNTHTAKKEPPKKDESPKKEEAPKKADTTPVDFEGDGFRDCKSHAGSPYVISRLIKGLSPSETPSVYCASILTLYPKIKQCQTLEDAEKIDYTKYFHGPLNANSLKGWVECSVLLQLSNENSYDSIEQVLDTKSSTDRRINCRLRRTFTMDFTSCDKARSYYNAVIIAEQGMELQQKVRTDLHNSNLQKNTNAALAKGESQSAVYDAAIDSSNHSKSLESEKIIAYTGAVSALSYAYSMIKGEGYVKEKCLERMSQNSKSLDLNPSMADKNCTTTIQKYRKDILLNQEAKADLAMAITTFITKGVAAGIARDQFGKKADIIGKAKEGPKYNDEPDMMLELCEFNPADPACVKRGNRVAGSRESANGTLSFDADDGVNSFNLNPASETFGEAGSETNLPDDKNNVAAINSPFKDAAQEAKGILNPADQAVVQATGGAGGGGGGGAGGGGGGGGASLGGDLKGAQKETSGDPQVKTGKVSGTYAASGGGGYKGVGKSKEDSGNPFSSLFDQKGSEGGVEEDRTIASGDIDGKASGLFEKISSRYSKIKADKRIEAQNLE